MTVMFTRPLASWVAMLRPYLELRLAAFMSRPLPWKSSTSKDSPARSILSGQNVLVRVDLNVPLAKVRKMEGVDLVTRQEV